MGYLLSIAVYFVLDWLTHPLWMILGLTNSTPEMALIRNVISLQITALTIGISQWYVVLRNNKIRYAAMWVSATALAYGVGLAIASYFYELSKQGLDCDLIGCRLDFPVVLFGAVMGSLVIGIITGVTITWLLRDHIAEQDKGSLLHLSENASH
jgi:hypothetical protein